MTKKLSNEINERNTFIDSSYGLTVRDGIDIKNYIDETIQMCLDNAYYQGLFDAYRNKALFEFGCGDHEVGLEFLQQAENLIMISELDDQNRIKLYHGYMLYYGEVIGDMEKAADYCRLGMEKAELHNDEEMLERMRMNMAVFYMYFKRYQAGVELLEDSLKYYQYYGDDNMTIYCHGNLGEGYLGLGNLEKAFEHYRIAYDIAVENNNVPIITEGAVGLSKIFEAQGAHNLAIGLLREAAEKAKVIQRDRYFIEIEIELARVYANLEAFDKVKQILKAIQESGHIDNHIDEIELYKIIISVAVHEKDYKTAYEGQIKLDELHQLVDKEKAENAINEMIRSEYNKTIERLETISDIGRELTTVRDLDEVSLLIKKKLSHIMHLDSLGVLELIDGVIHSNSVFDGELKLPINHKQLDDPKSLAAWAARNRKEVVINDLARDYKIYVQGITTRSANGTKKQSIQSLLFAPLIYKDEVIGVFTIQSYEKNAYSPEELEIFRIVLLYVTTALVNIRQSQALERMAYSDHLTGINNRHGFVEAYESVMDERGQDISSVSMIMLDLDYFKAINDRFGHLTGDHVLKVVGKRLKNQEREDIIVGRLGGEEFAVVMFNHTIDEAVRLGEKLRLHIHAIRVEADGEPVPVSTSVGVSCMKVDETYSYQKLYHLTDEALYKAKDLGRNRVEVHQ